MAVASNAIWNFRRCEMVGNGFRRNRFNNVCDPATFCAADTET